MAKFTTRDNRTLFLRTKDKKLIETLNNIIPRLSYDEILDGKLEASYPSSHTILALCTCITSLIVSKKYVSKKYIKLTNIITILLLFGVFLGRMFSGVHWLSDIIGGFLISLTLISYFNLMYNFKETR